MSSLSKIVIIDKIASSSSYPSNCVHPSSTNGKECCLLKTRNHAEVLEVRTQSLKLNPMENLRMFTTQKNTVQKLCCSKKIWGKISEKMLRPWFNLCLNKKRMPPKHRDLQLCIDRCQQHFTNIKYIFLKNRLNKIMTLAIIQI